MIKVAKPSSDPAQEKLRQTKKVWNKQVSEFADDLFRFKDMMNGKPSKFHPEKSSIKEPIPADAVTILGVLSSDFQDIVQKGNVIIRMQLEYSKARRKKQLKDPVTAPSGTNTTIEAPAAPLAPADLSTQLAASIEAYELIATASNPISRFFTHLLNPGIGSSPKARMRKYRMSLLKSAVEIYKDLAKLQAAIVSSSPESIFEASRILSKIEGNWAFFKSGLEVFKGYAPKVIPDSGKIADPLAPAPTASPSPASPQAAVPGSFPIPSTPEEIYADYKKNAGNFTGLDLKKLVSAMGVYRVAKDPAKKVEAGQMIALEYANAIAALNARFGTKGSSFREILELNKLNKAKTAANTSAQLEAVGQKSIQRWLGKMKHQLSPFDKTSAHRLDIYKAAEKTKVAIDTIMNSLEKEMNIDQLEKIGNEVSSYLKAMSYLMTGLEGTLRGAGFDKPFMDLLESGKITNYDPKLTPEQRKHLQRMIEQRRMRELTNMYQGNKR